MIERAVAKDPAERYPTAGALIEAAREHQGATPAATRVLTDSPGRRRVLGGDREGGRRRPRPPRALGMAGDSGGPRSPRCVVAALSSCSAAMTPRSPRRSRSAPRRCGGRRRRRGLGDERRRRHPDSGSTPRPQRVIRRAAPARHRHLRRRRRPQARSGSRARATQRGDPGRLRPPAPVTGGSTSAATPARDRHRRRPGLGGRRGGRRGQRDQPAGGRVFRRGIVPHVAPLRLASAPAASGSAAPRPAPYATSTWAPRLPGAPIRAGRGPAGVTVGGGLVWVANSRSDTVTRVDPSIRRSSATRSRSAAGPGGHRRRPQHRLGRQCRRRHGQPDRHRKRRVVGDPIDVGPEPGAIAIGGEAVWVANNGDGTVTRIEP